VVGYVVLGVGSVDVREANKLFQEAIRSIHEEEVEDLWGQVEDLGALMADEGISFDDAFEIASMREDESYGTGAYGCAIDRIREAADTGQSVVIGKTAITEDAACRIMEVYHAVRKRNRKAMEEMTPAKLLRVVDGLTAER
jgi:hypothetical protein